MARAKTRKEKLKRLFKEKALRTRILIVIVLFLLIAVILFITINLLSIKRLEMENNVERAFNDLMLAMEDSSIPVSIVMAEDGVNGFAIYSSYGNLLYSEGDVYQRLPLVDFEWGERNASTNSITNFDSSTNTMEYIRFSRKAVVPTTQSLLVSEELGLVDFPNIIYLSYDASNYRRDIIAIQIVMLLLLASSVFFFFYIIHVYDENVLYKEALEKQERLVSLGQAARTLTHEIKNPLSAITIQVAILKKTLPEDVSGDLDVIAGETKRLITLADRVSEFLHNPVGNPERISLEESIRSLFPLFKGKGDIKMKDYSGEYFVFFDKERFRSVFENIIKNAFESMDGMSEHLVEIAFSPGRKGIVRIFIRDRGCGIKEDEKAKIFDPFYTTKIHGSGIGLAISKQFIEASGGQIALRKRDGGGTEVEVDLPLA